MSNSIQETNGEQHTLYVRNLNEKVGLARLKSELRGVFEKYGDVLDIVAKKNIKAKGQAFIVFSSTKAAKEAFDSVSHDKIELFGKPMNVQFAKSVSDAILVKADGEQALEERLALRKRLHEKMLENRAKTKQRKKTPTGAVSTRTTTTTTSDEPPNKILFIQYLPEDTTDAMLDEVFGQFPGFVETRHFAVRHLAFIEYSTEAEAINAKEKTQDVEISGQTVSITYAKK